MTLEFVGDLPFISVGENWDQQLTDYLHITDGGKLRQKARLIINFTVR